MSREKILAFLKLNETESIDKFMMKFFMWFHVIGTVIIFLPGFAFHFIDVSWFHIAVFVFSVLTGILSLLSSHIMKNPVWLSIHSPTVAFCSMLLWFYGWQVYSESEHEYPKFTWIHIIVLWITLILGFYVFLKIFRVYRGLQTHMTEQAQFEVQKKTHGYGWVIVPLCGVPMTLVRVLKGPLKAMKLGAGFALWLLGCIWLLFILMRLTHIIVIFKYKVYQWFTVPSDVKKD